MRISMVSGVRPHRSVRSVMRTVGRTAAVACVLLSLLVSLHAQRPAEAVRQERERAGREGPQLMEVLGLKPGATVADVGAGGGATSVALAKLLGPGGRVYATDIGVSQIAEIKELVQKEALSNVIVLEGAVSATNLPDRCCDAILLRDVYHHLTRPQEFNASLLATLKAGGRLAILDFPPDPGSKVPDGVSNDRGGHGIAEPLLVAELKRAGFRHVRTAPCWPPDDSRSKLYLALFEKP
jgi:predicted methyltransferase